jgi:hypothetical protein
MKTENQKHYEHCELCERIVSQTTRHHLIPRTVHKNKWFRKNFEKEQMHETVDLCKDCHRQIHKFIPEKEMGRYYHTLEKLRKHEQVANFLEWLLKKSRV